MRATEACCVPNESDLFQVCVRRNDLATMRFTYQTLQPERVRRVVLEVVPVEERMSSRLRAVATKLTKLGAT